MQDTLLSGYLDFRPGFDGKPSGELDYAAIAVFLRLGFFLNNQTPWRRYRAALPEYPSIKPQNITRKATMEGYGDLFEQAIRRCAEPDYVMPLSGGRDSRHILFELCRQGHRPRYCVTAEPVPPRSWEDVNVSAEVCAHLGLEHRIVKQRDPVKAEFEKNELTQHCSDEFGWAMCLRPVLLGVAVVYDGIGGDVLSAGLFLDRKKLDLFEADKLEQLADLILPHGDESMFPMVLAPQFWAMVPRELAIVEVMKELRKHHGAANPIGSFYFWNRTRREIALGPHCLLNNVECVQCPYLDRDLFEFLYSLPAHMLLDHQLHSDLIKERYPEWQLRFEDDYNQLGTDPRSRAGRFGRGLIGPVAKSSLLNRGYVLPRLLASICGNWRVWIKPEMLAWLTQLHLWLLIAAGCGLDVRLT